MKSIKNMVVKRYKKEIGDTLNEHLIEINSHIPVEYSVEFRNLQKKDGFNLQLYINLLIDGSALKENSIDRATYNTCQTRFEEMQDYLKKSVQEMAEMPK